MRRSSIASLGLIALACCASPDQVPIGPPRVVIDAHTHLFNAKYLPLAGIFQKRTPWVLHPITDALAAAILRVTRTAGSLEPTASLLTSVATSPSTFRSEAEVRRAIASILPQLASEDDRVAQALALLPALLTEQVQTIETRIGILLESGAALTSMAEELAEQAGLMRFRDQIDARLDDVGALSNPHSLIWSTGGDLLFTNALLDQAWRAMGATPAYISWACLMTNDEIALAGRLQAEYPEVELFVHHMMDLDSPYDGEPEIDYATRQIPRMMNLVRSSDGKLMTFVAWDPSRSNSLAVVRAAILDGAAGVKFYPPSGYLPDDARNEPLFEFCEQEGVPIFTHCTPQGFEASVGSGTNSDPANWIPVLDRHPALILCLAHAGGALGWFTDDDAAFDQSFAFRAIELCRDHRNVYLEFGYLEEVAASSARAIFGSRLKRLLATSVGTGGTSGIGDRIVYGSDWHVICQESAHAAYETNFRMLFVDPELAPYADRFFRTNAIRFLNLERYIERNRSWLGVRGLEHLAVVSRGS